MTRLIAKHRAPVILLTGDVHYGEMMMHPCSKSLVGYDLWEVTASGMNSYYDTYFRWLNRALRLAPDTYNTHQDRVFRQNYGGVDVQWNTTHLNSS